MSKILTQSKRSRSFHERQERAVESSNGNIVDLKGEYQVQREESAVRKSIRRMLPERSGSLWRDVGNTIDENEED